MSVTFNIYQENNGKTYNVKPVPISEEEYMQNSHTDEVYISYDQEGNEIFLKNEYIEDPNGYPISLPVPGAPSIQLSNDNASLILKYLGLENNELNGTMDVPSFLKRIDIAEKNILYKKPKRESYDSGENDIEEDANIFDIFGRKKRSGPRIIEQGIDTAGLLQRLERIEQMVLYGIKYMEHSLSMGNPIGIKVSWS